MAQRYDERTYSLDEYLTLEERGPEKHEYFQGRIYAMSGSSPDQATITSNTGVALTFALKGQPCIVYSSDVHLQVKTSGLFTYADVSVVCGPPQYAPGRTNRMLLNPRLIVEVLSPSTESYDRGAKFRLYKGLESFRDYLLVDSREVYVQHYHKLDPVSWLEKTYTSLDESVRLENPGAAIALADLYAHIQFDPASLTLR